MNCHYGYGGNILTWAVYRPATRNGDIAKDCFASENGLCVKA